MSFIDKIFTNPLPSIEEIEAKHKRPATIEGARITRVAPSPTGFMHIGTIYVALICERVAHQTDGGVFFLRIEDTDTKREVEGAKELICSSLYDYNLSPDEGFDNMANEKGDFGPYMQSNRREIYQSYIKKMLQDGTAYICFATTEELDALRKEQEALSVRPGYYGRFAKSRNLTETEIEEKLAAKIPFVIRFKSPGNYENKIVIQDGLKGKIAFPENDLDIVIMKGDGLPTYHFAHAVDDYLMGTTHVIRGDEWLASLPLHIQLFKALGFKTLKYTHISPIQKLDDGKRRKLSKRKDPEADVRYYDEVGYPHIAVIEYLLNIANSTFEGFRRANPNAPYTDFKFELSKLSPSGALFDFTKLESISKEIIAKMRVDEIFENIYNWAKSNDVDLKNLIDENSDYVKSILSIERTGAKNARKDISKYSDFLPQNLYFFDDKFVIENDMKTELKNIKFSNEIVKEYLSIFDIFDTKEVWFEKMQNIGTKFSYAKNGKEYKENPSAFNGYVSTVVKIFRILLTGKTQTPDLCEVMKSMGETRVLKRLNEIENI